MSIDYNRATEIIKSNYPPENYTMLRESLDLAIKALEQAKQLEEANNECHELCTTAYTKVVAENHALKGTLAGISDLQEKTQARLDGIVERIECLNVFGLMQEIGERDEMPCIDAVKDYLLNDNTEVG